MYIVLLWKFNIRKHFAKMWYSRAIKFANISENKVLMNNREFLQFMFWTITKAEGEVGIP